MKMSTGLWNFCLVTGSIATGMGDGEIRIYAGVEPDRADDAIGAAVLLNTVLSAGVGINFDNVADGRVVLKAPAESWNSNNVADGAASFFRHVLPADTGAASTSALRIQGTVGAGGKDLNLGTTLLIDGAPCPVAFYSLAGSAR